MWSETNNWWVNQNGDEDLGLEDLICSRDPERLSQTSQTTGQGAKDLIKGHCSSAVILKDRKHKKLRLNLPETKTPGGYFCRHGPNKVQRALGAFIQCLVVVLSSTRTGFITSCLTTHSGIYPGAGSNHQQVRKHWTTFCPATALIKNKTKNSYIFQMLNLVNSWKSKRTAVCSNIIYFYHI